MKKPIPFGKYYLLERINVGGMAEVFRSKAYGVEGFERLVAVKRILPNIAEDKDFIKMFIDEAKISVQLNHANIAQIFDLGVVDGAYYIALEHVHGRDLRAIFDRCRTLGEPMPVAQACFVVMKVCEGLDYAHNKRDQGGKELHLVHRDVSPQNLLVSFEGEVKLIDFGIAKAAGKGAKTQAGILKGKFGYMSPEQVRGLPIDRRSDIFSCGIVLYELLTGERLFVGESDFSTLEKVRNVEILPPSTYNRKIPDELERIVLKALAKDVEDRYQNAIDLHDELQAFVYTAGEFYSRKDLAGWMKRTFAKEIDEETAKLESYRQLKPPTEPPKAAAAAVATTGPNATRPPPAPTAPQRRTTSMGAVNASGTKPPPPPVRVSQSMPIVAAPAAAMAAVAVAPAPAPSPKIQTRGEDDLAWDDDELETQIYDEPPNANDPDGKNVRRPTKSGITAPAPGATLEGVAAATADEPDLSSLVSTAKGWDSSPLGGGVAAKATGPATTLTGMGPPTGPIPTNGRSGNGRAATPLPGMDIPVGIAIGSNQAPSPYAPPRESAAIASHIAPNEPVFDFSGNIAQPANATFGSGMLGARTPGSNKTLYLIAGAVVVLAAIGITVALVMRDGNETTAGAPTKPGSGSQVIATAPQATGFDLYVTPPTVTRWRLDDEVRTDKLTSGMKIRNITPGIHQLHIEAPAGYQSESRQIEVKDGEAPRIDVNLSPVEITGTFDSTPPGANVFLLVDGQRLPLGVAPATAKLDPRKSYQVLFEKPDYVSKNMPVTIPTSGQAQVSAVLDKADAVAIAPPINPNTGGGTGKHGGGSTGGHGGGSGPATHPDGGGTTGGGTTGGGTTSGGTTGGGTTGGGTTGDTTPPAKGDGTLMITSKPPCDIFVDGKDMGVKTPQRELKLPSGKHKVTLVDNEYSIRETFWVEIKPGETAKASKDFMDKVQAAQGGGGAAPSP